MTCQPLVRLTAGVVMVLVCAHALVLADRGQEHSGGDATVFDEGHQAYGRALANLQPERWRQLREGKARFVGRWPQRGPSADATSCADCHFRDGRGPGPAPVHPGLNRLLRLGRVSGGVDPIYGAQLQRSGHGAPAPGHFEVDWQEMGGRYPSGERYTLRRPSARVTQLSQGPLDRSTRFSLRAPPAVFGLGLIEAISDHAITSLADPDDADGDGISGRAQRVRDASTGRMTLGRFGWKAAQPTLAAQSVAALRSDLGVTGADAEVAALARYLRALAVPARRRVGDPVVKQGERLFTQVGCGNCHRPRMATGELEGWPELSGQTIHPYTDLLLHEMGPRLADEVSEGRAVGAEWRTPPLWGLGLLPVVSGPVGLLHDGRARSPEEAILWHGGEAAAAVRRFMALERVEREALTTFLDSL